MSENERASIDDLLSSRPREEEPPVPPRKPRSRRGLSLLGFSAGWTLAAFIVLRVLDQSMPLHLLFAVCLAVVALWRLWRGLTPSTRSRQAGRHPAPAPQPDTADGLKAAVDRWETVLDWCQADVARFQRRLQPRLGELVDERLRQRHGISRAADPERARMLLGDPLWTFLTVPPRRPPHPREFAVIVNALERL